MKKIFTLLILMMMLPVTVLAAETNTVYVGGVALTGSSDGIVYATTNGNGEVITEGATTDNYNIKWDGSTLTLCKATIKKELYASDLPLSNIAGAAIGVINQSGDAGLTVQLEGNNKIEGVSTGIRVRFSGGNTALNITGNGTLVVNSNYPTIQVISIGGNAALSIENAKVTATSSYSNVVTVESNSSENSTLTVNGGGLIATAQSNNVSGIRLRGTGETGGSSPTVTVSNNAIVRANGSAGGITSDSSTGVQYGTGSDSTGGIVFDGTKGTVYGDVTLQEDITICEGESLTIGKDASLTVPEETTLINNGTVTTEEGGTLTGNITNAPPKITTESLNEGTVNAAYNQTLAADNNPTSWSVTNGALPKGLTLENGTISGTPTAAGTSTFTVKAENTAGSDSKEYKLTIKSVSVTDVKLDKTELSLYTGESATLNATVEPDNATNKNVTWESSNPNVATVDNGKVTAMSVGDAIITATAGDMKATCKVKVRNPPVIITYHDLHITESTGAKLVSRYDKKRTPDGGSFTLSLEKEEGYEDCEPTVYYKRGRFGEWKELKLDEVSGYYQIRSVYTDIYVKVSGDGIWPVSNEEVEAQEVKVYTQNGAIIVSTPSLMDVQIISMTGSVVAADKVAGQREFRNLAEGIYVVRVGEDIVKVRL